MGILINVLDMGLHGTNDVVRREMADMMFRYDGEHTIRIRPPDSFGARTALNSAATISRTHGSIQKIRIIGHGGPGVQSIGRGNWSQVDYSNPRAVSGASTFDVLSHANVDSLYPELARLSRCFAEDGVFEFHGCNVGAGEEGSNLLRKTARYVGVTVFAGVPLQYSSGGGRPSHGGHEYYNGHLEGNLKRATPNGAVGYSLPMGQWRRGNRHREHVSL